MRRFKHRSYQVCLILSRQRRSQAKHISGQHYNKPRSLSTTAIREVISGNSHAPQGDPILIRLRPSSTPKEFQIAMTVIIRLHVNSKVKKQNKEKIEGLDTGWSAGTMDKDPF